MISQVNPAPDLGGPAEHVPTEDSEAIAEGSAELAASGAEGSDCARGNATSTGHRHRYWQSPLSRHGLCASGDRAAHTPGRVGSRADVIHVPRCATQRSCGDSCSVEEQAIQGPSVSTMPKTANGLVDIHVDVTSSAAAHVPEKGASRSRRLGVGDREVLTASWISAMLLRRASCCRHRAST